MGLNHQDGNMPLLFLADDIFEVFLIAVGHYIPLRKNLGIYLCQTHLAHHTTSCLVTYKRYSYTPDSNFHQLHCHGWRFSVSCLNSVTAVQIFLTISIIKIDFQSQFSHGLSLLFSPLHCRLFLISQISSSSFAQLYF